MSFKSKFAGLSHSLLLLALVLLASCTDDLKGDSGARGADGTDATASALISLKRPNYEYVDDTHISVPGTGTYPAQTYIDGVVYSNTGSATLDFASLGRNGLDSGTRAANTVYYLYALPTTSGDGFDLVASILGPTTGPIGFDQWSYLGAFLTGDSPDKVILPFVKEGDFLRFVSSNSSEFLSDVATVVPTFTAAVPPKPETTSLILLFIGSHTVSTAGSQSIFVSSDGDDVNYQQLVANVGGVNVDPDFLIPTPITDPDGRIWVAWRVAPPAGWTFDLRMGGWWENPTDWN